MSLDLHGESKRSDHQTTGRCPTRLPSRHVDSAGIRLRGTHGEAPHFLLPSATARLSSPGWDWRLQPSAYCARINRCRADGLDQFAGAQPSMHIWNAGIISIWPSWPRRQWFWLFDYSMQNRSKRLACLTIISSLCSLWSASTSASHDNACASGRLSARFQRETARLAR